jgi:DegV family protein with EDD domain
MINIIADSGADVSKDFADEKTCTITHVPLNLQVDETVFIDDNNLDLTEYLNAMEASKQAVKTSAPSPNLFFEQFKAAGENVFVVTLSSKLSATYQSAMAAKDMYLEECGKKFIHIVDSMTAAIGEGAVTIKLTELAKKGLGVSEIVEQINTYVKELNTYFILDKFDNLVKTGRVKPYVAKLASVLNIKPICGASDGEIKMFEKARGYTKAASRLIQMIKENTPDIENRFVAITHVAAYEKAVAFKEELLAHIKPKDVFIVECRGVTTTYANRGGIVVAV